MSVTENSPLAAACQTGGLDTVVDVRGLTKHFGVRQALAGIDLSLATGQIVGIVGPDGAGKTTLIRALAGLLDVQATEARVLGYDLRGDVTALKAQMGYVPQSFSLQRDLSVMENLRFTARLHRVPATEFQARARDLLARTQLTPFVDRSAGALSGGMKQKLAVANALLLRPRLLLLDEPTAGVDVLARGVIWSMLQAERPHALIVISTSYVDEAEACDRLIYLDAGHIVANGTPEQLRDTVPLELYRAWGDDPRAIAACARQLGYVKDARASGGFTRIEIRSDHTPGTAHVLDDLAAIAGVHFVEQLRIDMESTLLHLARGAAA